MAEHSRQDRSTAKQSYCDKPKAAYRQKPRRFQNKNESGERRNQTDLPQEPFHRAPAPIAVRALIALSLIDSSIA
jgi:hypothetical protein